MENQINQITNNWMEGSNANIKKLLESMDKSIGIIVKGGQASLSATLLDKRPDLHTSDKLITMIEYLEKVYDEKPANINDYITHIPPVCLEQESITEMIQKANEVLELLNENAKQLLNIIIKILHTYETN